MNDFAQNLSAMRGESALRSFDFEAGDVLLFQGRTWHRGVTSGKARAAICLRFVPAGARHEGLNSQDLGLIPFRTYLPRECDVMTGPLFPLVFPEKANATSSGETWPVVPRRYAMIAAGMTSVINL